MRKCPRRAYLYNTSATTWRTSRGTVPGSCSSTAMPVATSEMGVWTPAQLAAGLKSVSEADRFLWGLVGVGDGALVAVLDVLPITDISARRINRSHDRVFLARGDVFPQRFGMSRSGKKSLSAYLCRYNLTSHGGVIGNIPI